eukprot:169759_1
MTFWSRSLLLLILVYVSCGDIGRNHEPRIFISLYDNQRGKHLPHIMTSTCGMKITIENNSKNKDYVVRVVRVLKNKFDTKQGKTSSLIKNGWNLINPLYILNRDHKSIDITKQLLEDMQYDPKYHKLVITKKERLFKPDNSSPISDGEIDDGLYGFEVAIFELIPKSPWDD